MKKLLITLLLLFLLVALLISCNSNDAYINDDDVIKIGFIPETMTVERWQRDRDIFVAKVKELGAEVIVKNAYEDSEIQKQIGIDMIDQGVDVLVIVVYDKNSLSDLVAYAHSKNVKVIAYDRLIKNANVDLYITFDNFRVGELIGEAIVEQVPYGNYLILNGSQTDNNAFMFRDGYMSVVQPKIDNGDIKVVGETWISAWRDEISYAFVSGMLSEGLEFDGIIAANDRVAEGAVNALSENRLAGDIVVTGQDAELAGCQRIVEGTQYMTVYKSIQTLAEGAAEMAVKMAMGEDIPVEETIFDGTYNVNYIKYEPISVTKENINQVVIEAGFYTYEQVYINIPKEEWHKYD